jgi:hypothetical protein
VAYHSHYSTNLPEKATAILEKDRVFYISFFMHTGTQFRITGAGVPVLQSCVTKMYHLTCLTKKFKHDSSFYLQFSKRCVTITKTDVRYI